MHATRLCRFGVLATALLLIGAAPEARADVLILESSVKGLAENTVLLDGATLSIPADEVVVIMLPSGATERITGPASRPVDELTKGQAESEAYKLRRDQAKDAIARLRAGGHANQVGGSDARRIFCEELESLYQERGCAKSCSGKCPSWAERHNSVCADNESLACTAN